MAARRKPKQSTADKWLPRLDESIELLAHATTDLNVGVAAHTQRLDQMEQQGREQRSELQKLSAAREGDYRTLSDRISVVQTDLTDKLNQQTLTVTKKMDEVKQSITSKIDEGDHKLAVRVKRLESWRTFIAGGAFIIVVIFTYVLLKLIASVVPWASFLK